MAVAKGKFPDMSRDKDLAGQTVSKGGYNITYDNNGYATSATNYNHSMVRGTSEGVAAPSADAVKSSGSRSGGSAYDKSYMSDSDLASINQYRDAYKAAQAAGDTAGMNLAHSQADAIRSKYGYTGGADGSEYNPIPVTQRSSGGSSGGGGGGRSSGGGVSGSFSYGNAPQYVNRYQSQIDALTAQILGREAFSYDPETDPAYQQYRESYTRGGERAMQDTLAQMAARTGGLASSYANAVSQQTYDNYMAALADKVPELRQLAYSMYQDEGNNLRSNLNMLASLEQGDYGKFADQLAQFNTDRNFNYGAYRDTIGDQRYSNEWNYQVGRDQLDDQRYNDETAWTRSQYATETEYNQALAKAQMLASIGDFSGYKALGYSDAEIANLTNAYNAAQLLAQQQSTTRRTYKSGGGDDGTGNGDIYQQMYDAGIRSYDDAYAWLRANGIGTTDANRYANGLVNKIKGGDFGTSGGGNSSTSGFIDLPGIGSSILGNLFGRIGGEDTGGTLANYAADDLSWIAVPGLGRVTPQELKEYVDSGVVKETISKDGKYNYTLVR